MTGTLCAFWSGKAAWFALYEPSGSNCDGFVAGVAAMFSQTTGPRQKQSIQERLPCRQARAVQQESSFDERPACILVTLRSRRTRAK